MKEMKVCWELKYNRNALYQAKKYKYNNARVMKITPAMCNVEYFIDNYDRRCKDNCNTN